MLFKYFRPHTGGLSTTLRIMLTKEPCGLPRWRGTLSLHRMLWLKHFHMGEGIGTLPWEGGLVLCYLEQVQK